MWWLTFSLIAVLLLVAINTAPACDKVRRESWKQFCMRNIGMIATFAFVSLMVMVVVASAGYSRRR